MGDGYAANGFAKGKAVDLGTTTLANGTGAGGTLITEGYDWLTVFFRIGNATTPAAAAGDLGITVVPTDLSGVSWPGSLTSDNNIRGQALTNGIANVAYRWQLNGLDQVRINVFNNNATTPLQGATAIYYLSR